jgi:hypothetical protein
MGKDCFEVPLEMSRTEASGAKRMTFNLFCAA